MVLVIAALPAQTQANGRTSIFLRRRRAKPTLQLNSLHFDFISKV
jgi:hypothetical protein